MADTRSPVCPFLTLDRSDLASILYGLSDVVTVYEAVFDDFHSIVDGRLIWWNDAFREICAQPVRFRQSLVETYFEPHSALMHMQNAWNTGMSVQLFEFGPSARGRLRFVGDRVAYAIKWQRVGDYLVEVGNDVSEVLAMQEQLADQKSIIATVHHKRALAVERERIARNLHDSVIQQLYALSLSLSLSGAAHNSEEQNLELIDSTITSIAGVIEGIRLEIFDVESKRAALIEDQLEDLLLPIVRPVGGDFSIFGSTPRLSPELLPHIRAVCTEAASNAVRHGRASHIDIAFGRSNGNLMLTISDNGMGIESDSSLGNGLKNMRERAKHLGGTMRIETHVGQGTTITWVVPHPGWSE